MAPTAERRRQPTAAPPAPHTAARALGLGLVSGAANDDPVAIGTYASAGARFGSAVLWAAPALLPLMAVMVYLASKLGHVAGQGLAAIIRDHYSRRVLWLVVAGVLVVNTIEAAADLGGVAAALNLLIPLPIAAWVVPLGAGVLAVQWFGSYAAMRGAFRWLALALLAYIGSALLAHPHWREVGRATLFPAIHLSRDYLVMLVAVVGTALTPSLFVWQASQEVEEDVWAGKRRLGDRRGTTAGELRATAWDVIAGMVFSALVMYFIILSTAATLAPVAWGSLHSAVEVAQALRPLAGRAAGALFALGVIGVGLLAVPVMTAGAAYVVCDARGWRSGLGTRPREAPQFYAVIAAVTAVALGLNFLGINPIRALVCAGLIGGLLAPALMLLILLMTNNRAIMGRWTNSRAVNVVGWAATLLATAAVGALLAVLALT